MNPTLNFEAEHLELEEESSSCGPKCHCAHCQGGGVSGEEDSEADFEADFEAAEDFEDSESALEAADFEYAEEALADEADFEAPFGEESFTEEAFDCNAVATNCDMTAADEKRVRKAGKPEGDILDRTQGDRTLNLALQLTDYNVNDWRAGQKERHNLGLLRIQEFIKERRAEILAAPNGIQVSITGSASQTGSKEYNDTLSCKRATCVANHLRAFLEPALQPKVRFVVTGEGFQKATCKGTDCELGEYRSVLICVHRPEKKPPPVPIVPPGWNKYRIRNCSYKTEGIGDVIVDELLKRGIDALPESLRRILSETPAGQSLLKKGLNFLISKLKSLLLKAPGALGKLFGAISKFLSRIPLQIIRDTGIFQIVETGKPDAKELVLRYTGFGFRILIPRDAIAGIPDFVLNEARSLLKKALNLDDFAIDILFSVTGKIPTIESTTPGPFRDFQTSRLVKLKVFEGPGESLKGIQLGTVFLGFSSQPFIHPDPAKRIKISCSGCAPSQIPVKIGSGSGFEVVAPTKGSLVDCACKCEPVKITQGGISRLTTRRIAINRALAARRPAKGRAPQRAAVR